jgi:hypothetical protein
MAQPGGRKHAASRGMVETSTCSRGRSGSRMARARPAKDPTTHFPSYCTSFSFSPAVCFFPYGLGGGSSLHSGIEFGRSRTGEGSSGEEEGGGVRSGPGEARTIPLFHTISARPPASYGTYLPSARCLGWSMHCCAEVTESSTNKQHHLSVPVKSEQPPVPGG